MRITAPARQDDCCTFSASSNPSIPGILMSVMMSSNGSPAATARRMKANASTPLATEAGFIPQRRRISVRMRRLVALSSTTSTDNAFQEEPVFDRHGAPARRRSRR